MQILSPLKGLFAFALWIAAEIFAFNLVASWTGGGVAFFLLIMKSVLGALFIKRVIQQKLFAMLRRGGGVILEGAAASEAWLKGLGGFLIIAPGFVAGLAGLALLTPSVRAMLPRRSGSRAVNPRDIDLESGEWREVRRPRAPRIGKRTDES